MRITCFSGARRRSLWKAPSIITAFCLLVLLIGNLSIDDWKWGLSGFAVVGSLIWSFGFAYELATRSAETPRYRVAMGITLGATFLSMWSNFVQFVDVNHAAIVYFAVPLVAMFGAALARLRPAAMARALFVTAFAQGVAVAIALLMRNSQLTPWSPELVRGYLFNSLAVFVFALAGVLFRKSIADQRWIRHDKI